MRAWVPSRKTLLQNIEVLSAGQDFKKDAEGKPVMVQVVNMLVTPDAGRATQPGRQPDQHSTGAAQSVWITISPRLPGPRCSISSPVARCSRSFHRNCHRARAHVPRAMPIPVRAVAPPAPPKEMPFVMEIISGPTKREQKFGGTPEVK